MLPRAHLKAGGAGGGKDTAASGTEGLNLAAQIKVGSPALVAVFCRFSDRRRGGEI